MKIIILISINIVLLFATDKIDNLLQKANLFLEKNQVQEAIVIYDKLIKEDVIEANYNLGMIYGFGIGDIEKNITKSIENLQIATLGYHKKAPYYLALILSSVEDKNETVIMKNIIQSATSGYDKAELAFAKLLLDNNNTKDALEWINKARKQGNKDAEILWNKFYHSK